jgi:hypothetical protein
MSRAATPRLYLRAQAFFRSLVESCRVTSIFSLWARNSVPCSEIYPLVVGSREEVVLILIRASFAVLAAANTLRARAPLPKAAITLRIFFIELASGSKAMTLNPGLSTTENVM